MGRKIKTMFYLWIKRVKKFIVNVLITLVLNLALGAITYFFLKSFTNIMTENNDTFRNSGMGWLIIVNGLQAIGIVLALGIFGVFEKNFRAIFLRFLFLTLWLFLVDEFMTALIYRFDDFWNALFHYNILGLVFGTNNILSGILTYTYNNYEKNRTKKILDQEYQLLELKELKTKAELEALQAKINPHFLYNSLNAIASLIHENPNKAEEMVLLLSKFFRYSTNAKSQYLTRIIDEIDMVKTYLQVEKVRFDERMEYHIFFENEKLKDCLIPQFLLQPLVENAIKHGISKMTDKGILHIDIIDKNERIEIIISDNGAPFPNQINTGYGLRSTQDKLRLLMGEDAKMEIINGKNNFIINGDNIKPSKSIRILMKKCFLQNIN